mmetsp:Transcript_45986/g.131276  ORF Transcript_45986/g.131276 Transcript_45986/m.131276 type:complete len:217 (-) Transcript_45986:174-824(-)
MSTGLRSEMGLAVTMLPASTATFRICALANQWSISRIAFRPRHSSPGRSFTTASRKCSMVARLTAPPMMSEPSLSKPISCSSETDAVEIMAGYSHFLNFVSMPTSVLPATSLASGMALFSASSVARSVGRYQVTFVPVIFSGSGAGAARRACGKAGPPASSPQAAATEAIAAFVLLQTCTSPSSSGRARPPSGPRAGSGHRSLSQQNVLAASRIGR